MFRNFHSVRPHVRCGDPVHFIFVKSCKDFKMAVCPLLQIQGQYTRNTRPSTLHVRNGLSLCTYCLFCTVVTVGIIKIMKHLLHSVDEDLGTGTETPLTGSFHVTDMLSTVKT